MKLKEFIERLKELDNAGHGDIPVALSDWSEEYAFPNEKAAQIIEITTCKYYPADSNNLVMDSIVIIGKTY